VEWICQYNETPYQFMRRMAYDFGEFFYFDGVNLCYGRPSGGQEPIKVVYGQDCQDLQIGFELKAVGQSHLAWSSGEDKKLVKDAPKNIDGLSGFSDQLYQKSQRAFAKGLVPAPFRASQAQLLELGVKSHAAAEAADMYKVSGKSSRHELRVGATIHLFAHKVDESYQVGGEDLGHFIVTKVVHSMEGNGAYNNQFEAIPVNAPMLPMGEVEYPLAEAQPAVVMNNNDPLGQGRVRVRFHWSVDDTGTTDWIKVLTPDAGGSDKVSKNRGLVVIPEMGDLVMVNFRYGQPDQPFVVGSMHTGTKASGGGQGNNIKSLSSKSGNKLELNDKEGSVYLTDHGGVNMKFDGGGNATTNANANHAVNAGNSHTTGVGGKEDSPPQSLLHMDANGNITLDAKTSITLKVGDHYLSIDNNGKIQINGKDVIQTATNSPQIESKTTSISAKGGICHIESDQNITISGTNEVKLT
jgi:uncharacterized protein involved in type VI secretion and phage assembly